MKKEEKRVNFDAFKCCECNGSLVDSMEIGLCQDCGMIYTLDNICIKKQMEEMPEEKYIIYY